MWVQWELLNRDVSHVTRMQLIHGHMSLLLRFTRSSTHAPVICPPPPPLTQVQLGMSEDWEVESEFQGTEKACA